MLFSLHALQVSTADCAAELEKQVRDLQQAGTDQEEVSGEAQASAHHLQEQLEQATRSSLAKDAELASVKVTWHPALQFTAASAVLVLIYTVIIEFAC